MPTLEQVIGRCLRSLSLLLLLQKRAKVSLPENIHETPQYDDLQVMEDYLGPPFDMHRHLNEEECDSWRRHPWKPWHHFRKGNLVEGNTMLTEDLGLHLLAGISPL